MIDARAPSLLQFNEHNDIDERLTQFTFLRPQGRGHGHYSLLSNDLQGHCQQYHLRFGMTTAEFITPFKTKRTSNNDVIVGIRWELRDLFIDPRAGLCDSESKKDQRLEGQVHGRLQSKAPGSPRDHITSKFISTPLAQSSLVQTRSG